MRAPVRIAQLLLVIAAAALWLASRLQWVEVRSFDGLGQPRTATLTGGTWSTALVPLALLLLAAAVATLAVRAWPLRLLALLIAAVSAGTAYLAVSQWVVRDVAVRAAELAQIPVSSLVGSQRSYWGAAITLGAAVLALTAAVLLMRAASGESEGRARSTKYAAPAARRAALQSEPADADMSERMIWDALDEGLDPTDRISDPTPPPQASTHSDSDTEGR